jgi:4-amino-4-deoxy-L-arabinose transferase-like glycosyltransferase
MKKFIVYLFLAGLVLRIFAIFLVRNYYEPSDYEYGEIARNIVNGKGFSRAFISEDKVYLTSSHAPVYPYFLAFFYQFGRKPSVFIFIQIIQAIISAITIVIIYRISEIIFNRKAANLSAIGVALYPVFIFYATKLVPTTFFMFFLSLSIFLILKDRRPGFLFLSGAILGFTILCDPVAFMVIPALVLWWLVIKKYDFKKLIIIISISFLILIPWTVRNYLVHRHFVPVTTQFGLSFWLGNNLNATGTDYFRVNPESRDDYIFMLENLPENIRDSLSNIDEVARSRYYMKEGINFIRENPFRSFKLFMKKFYYYWWFAPQSIYVSKDIERYGFLIKIFYLPILLTGGIGFIFSRKYIKDTSFLLMIIFSISSLYIIAHVGLIRYRVILEPYLIIFASFFFSSLNIKFKKPNDIAKPILTG